MASPKIDQQLRNKQRGYLLVALNPSQPRHVDQLQLNSPPCRKRQQCCSSHRNCQYPSPDRHPKNSVSYILPKECLATYSCFSLVKGSRFPTSIFQRLIRRSHSILGKQGHSTFFLLTFSMDTYIALKKTKAATYIPAHPLGSLPATILAQPMGHYSGDLTW